MYGTQNADSLQIQSRMHADSLLSALSAPGLQKNSEKSFELRIDLKLLNKLSEF